MSITIVTAFFDIGRGAWSVENGHPSYLGRSTDKYFKYFSNLAELENDMIVFTSQEFVTRIKEIRGNKPTRIIDINLDEKFSAIKKQIADIQNSEVFKSKVGLEELKNPEYWSAEYVLVTNLKSYFVSEAINSGLINTNLAAWVDFGYCRNLKKLDKIKEWNFPFSEEKVNFFSIKKAFEINEKNINFAIYNNQVFIIGGVIVAAPSKWLEFYNLVYSCQKDMLSKKIIDDDQGVYLQALLRQPDLFEIHYLGEDCWFDVFKRYDETTHLNLKNRFKKLMGYF